MYLKRTTVYRDRIEIYKYHTSRYGVKGEKRGKRVRPSDSAVKAANERAARRRLKGLLIENFEQGDYHVVLTYAPDKRPEVEESRDLLKKFIRDCRSAYRKAGSDLKYIVTTEWQGKSIHHHIIMNDVAGFSKIVAGAWTHGGAHFTALYPDYDYDGLAEYMVKETCKTFRDPDCAYRQRYTCSRNLKKPQEIIEVIKANGWTKDPKVSKTLTAAGYQISGEIDEGVDLFGYEYQRYTLKRYPVKHKRE